MTGILLLLFGSFLAMILIEFPIALALGLASLITIVVFSIAPLELVPQLMFATGDSFTLLAIPFFIFTGILLGKTSISRRIIDFADCLVTSVPGGLGIVGILAAVFFAGISGSGPAAVAALGLVIIPAMVEAGYDRGFAAALTASSGGIGIIIPPSIALIVYGFIAEVSITKLFIAGLIPGLLVAGSFIFVTIVLSIKRGYGMKTGTRKKMPVLIAFRRAFWGLLAPLIILGGIYGGVFTPTEAAAVAVVYSLVVDMLIYKAMTFREVLEAAGEAAVTSSVIMLIVLSASLYAWILNVEGIAASLATAIVSLISSKALLLLFISVLLIGAGLFLDAISIFYIFLPILLPVIRTVGIDPLHFGIVMTVNLAIGQITPPVGVNLVSASGISDVDIRSISRAAIPFIAAESAALLLIMYVPALSLFLPGLF